MLFISSEGTAEQKELINPSLLTFSKEGRQLTETHLPQVFQHQSQDKDKKGFRNNAAGEGLALSPDQRNLALFFESPLHQDGKKPNPRKGAHVRGLIYAVDSEGGLDLKKQVVYELSSQKMLCEGGKKAEWGVGEVAYLSASQLLVLERGGQVCPGGEWRASALLYLVDLNSGSDISQLETLKDASYQPLSKSLVLDFETILPSLSEAYRSLGNLEGMVVFRLSVSGPQYLMLVSDDNFSKKLRNQFLLFALR